MSLWIPRVVVLLASIVMIAIRAPHGQRSRQVTVARSHRGVLEIVLLTTAWVGFFIPLIWVAYPPIFKFAEYATEPVSVVGGTLLLAFSLYVFFRSHADLGTNWSITLEVREKHRLVVDGVYRRIRHPMYLALFLYGVGQALVLANWFAGPSYFVVMFVMFCFRLRAEEHMMVVTFGKDYEQYMARTKRLIPGVW